MEKLFKPIGKRRFLIILILVLSGCAMITVASIIGLAGILITGSRE